MGSHELLPEVRIYCGAVFQNGGEGVIYVIRNLFLLIGSILLLDGVVAIVFGWSDWIVGVFMFSGFFIGTIGLGIDDCGIVSCSEEVSE